MSTTHEKTHLNGELQDETKVKRTKKNAHPNKSRPIGAEQYKKLKEACKNPKLLRAMAMLFYFGFRVNEPMQFKRIDIEKLIANDEAQAFISKQGIKRTLFLSEEMKEDLIMLLNDCKSEVFINYKGDSLRVCLNRHIHKILGEGYSSHGFRRDFVTDIVRKTGNITLASEAVGHRSKATTMGYVHVTEDDLKSAYSLRSTN